MSRKCEQCIASKLNSLNSLSKEELFRISNCKKTKFLKKGELLFDEGVHINGIYCIQKGVCKVSKMGDNGRDQILNFAKQGDLIGERSLISNEASNSKAIAISNMEVCFIPKEEIIRDLEKNTNFSMSVLKRMALSLKKSDDIIVDLAQKTVKQRLASVLLFLEDQFTRDEEGENIEINLSREDIASIVGTATESAIRLLSDFKKKRLIELKGKKIFVLDRNTLDKLARGF